MAHIVHSLRGDLRDFPLVACLRSMLLQVGKLLSAAVQRSPSEHPLP